MTNEVMTNTQIKDIIMAYVLTYEKPKTLNEISKDVQKCNEFIPRMKIAALLIQLVKDGKIIKIDDITPCYISPFVQEQQDKEMEELSKSFFRKILDKFRKA